jgi:hypothetical protein
MHMCKDGCVHAVVRVEAIGSRLADDMAAASEQRRPRVARTSSWAVTRLRSARRHVRSSTCACPDRILVRSKAERAAASSPSSDAFAATIRSRAGLEPLADTQQAARADDVRVPPNTLVAPRPPQHPCRRRPGPLPQHLPP